MSRAARKPAPWPEGSLTAVDLFCGMGGATEGLRRAGVRVVAAMDGWTSACVAHRRWHPDVPTVKARVEDLPLNGAAPWLCWASPSCKPYSVANRTPKRGKLHPEYYPLARLVAQAVAMRARWLVIENVGGLAWSREGRAELGELWTAIQAHGLRAHLSIVNSNSVGVVQIRRRVIIVVGPEYVKIGHGNEYVPPENAETPPMACEGAKGSWERKTRWPKATPMIVRGGDGGVEGGHALRRLRARRAVEAGEHVGRLRTRDGVPEAAPHGRTLAECCELQQVPFAVLAGFSKRVAHELVGNCVPPPLAEHVVRTLRGRDGA